MFHILEELFLGVEFKGSDISFNSRFEFIEIDVNAPENEPEFNKLFEVTKCYDVPMVKVGNQILVPNTSFRSIREAADLTKKFLV